MVALSSSEAPVPTVHAVGRALPPHYVPQEQLVDAFRERWATRHFHVARLEELHRAVSVHGRHLALPVREYAALDTFAKRNRAWTEAALDLGEQAVRDALG